VSARQSAMRDPVSTNSVEAKWDHGRSCQLPCIPLPDFVIAFTFVIGVKSGSSARTFYEICCAFKGRSGCDATRAGGIYPHHDGVRVEQAKALPIVDNADVSSRYGRK